MSSLRQIEANRRNARLSTGPITEEGKKKSRRNALRHGLTAETVIDVFEDADDYAAFEMVVTADYDAQSAVERELVLRLASLLWRLRRVTAIEAGLFKEQARQLLRFGRGHQRRRQKIRFCPLGADGSSTVDVADQYDALTQGSLGIFLILFLIAFCNDVRLVKSYSPCGAWTVASRGRDRRLIPMTVEKAFQSTKKVVRRRPLRRHLFTAD